MRRNALLVIPILVSFCVLVGAIRLLHTDSLTAAEITPQHLPVPQDYDCSALQRSLVPSESKPTESTSPLTENETAIYRAVLAGWNSGTDSPLNVADQTEPFDPSDHSATLPCACLEGFEASGVLSVSRTFHSLTRELLPDKRMRLVDPAVQSKKIRMSDPSRTIGMGVPVDQAVKDAFASGLFTLSEIAFDARHQRALVRYSFYCGGLCGSGRTVLFKKVNDTWKASDQQCGGWIS